MSTAWERRTEAPSQQVCKQEKDPPVLQVPEGAASRGLCSLESAPAAPLRPGMHASSSPARPPEDPQRWQALPKSSGGDPGAASGKEAKQAQRHRKRHLHKLHTYRCVHHVGVLLAATDPLVPLVPRYLQGISGTESLIHPVTSRGSLPKCHLLGTQM